MTLHVEQIYAGCTRLRLELVDWLGTLSAAQLDTPSLCSEWTVREVAGHLVVSLEGSPRQFVVEILRRGFSIDRANAALASRAAAQPFETLLTRFRDSAGKRLKVPVVGVHGPLIDLLVHGGDMRLPLGLPMPAEADLAVEAMDYLAKGTPGLVPKSRLAGLQLVSVDLDRSWREGAPVEGELNDLLMAVCGRRAVLKRLDGPGAKLLAERI
jgi:uncharacterized protein (TIGR03083 family)